MVCYMLRRISSGISDQGGNIDSKGMQPVEVDGPSPYSWQLEAQIVSIRAHYVDADLIDGVISNQPRVTIKPTRYGRGNVRLKPSS